MQNSASLVGPEVRMRSWQSLVLPTVVAVVGCSSGSEPTAPAGTVSFSHTGIPDINGRIFIGTGRTNLCTRFADGSPLVVAAIPVGVDFFNVVRQVCPANDFSLPVEPGSYRVRVNLPLDQPRGQLPQRWLEPGLVSVDAADILKDIHVRNGLPLAGRATVDGSTPVAGLSLTALYSDLEGFAGGLGNSGPTGAWQDAVFPSPLILQTGVGYTLTGCQVPAPGIREVRVTPAGPFAFPTESDRLNCDFITGDALRYTHKATRLKLTSYPGDIGGFSDPFIFPDLGYGYSAQFPLPAGESPKAGPAPANRQLFRGGLVLGIAPDVAFAGTELGGYVTCLAPCRDLGFDGQASVVELGGGSRDISWRYSDAGSQRAIGLEVSQHSYDGQDGADYVLYAFRITNRSRGSITFAPGVFLDFDVHPDFASNIGYTELDGQLMITTNSGDVGTHLGSLIVNGPPVPRPYFFTGNDFPAEGDLVAALRGELSNRGIPEPGDIRHVQGGTTIKLTRGKSTDLWVAIVGGDDRTQTVANARSAIADADRRRMGDVFSAFTGRMASVRSLGVAAQSSRVRPSGPLCKAGCGPK
jgi:hypothetical protein